MLSSGVSLKMFSVISATPEARRLSLLHPAWVRRDVPPQHQGWWRHLEPAQQEQEKHPAARHTSGTSRGSWCRGARCGEVSRWLLQQSQGGLSPGMAVPSHQRAVGPYL